MDSPLTGIKLGTRHVVRLGDLLIGSVLSNEQSLILDHSKSDGDTPTELINIRKVCSDCLCPARLKLLEYQAGFLPAGDSNWSHTVVKLNS
jgi:hypothetical protein